MPAVRTNPPMNQTDVTYPHDLDSVDWPDDAVFVVDDALPPALADQLPAPIITVEAGESLKSLDRIEQLAESIFDERASRPLTIVGVGGGAVGDAIGFVASILWRGVGLWHVPTTLVAMVDSAHGGKTAVNLGARKNQLGTFYPADRVVVSTAVLETLPPDLREEGLVELLKALWLVRPEALAPFDDPATYHHLLTDPVDDHRTTWTELLESAVEAKYEVVDRDPREQTGHRRILNLGHTAGHGLEALLGLPHGRAVGWGLAAAAELSCRRAGLSTDDRDRLLDHIDPLLVPLPRLDDTSDREQFLDHLSRDKKWEDGDLISILLDGPGEPVQRRDVSPTDWREAVGRAADRWRDRPLAVSPPDRPRPHSPELPPDKSRANRAAIIAAVRPGPTEISGPDTRPPADVLDITRALAKLDAAPDDGPLELDAGEGGTTTRFLMALAATRTGPTNLQLAPPLRDRPHEPLAESLRDGGADIEETDQGYRIAGWNQWPEQLTVDASLSSQFASAPALLAATGRPLSLRIATDMASRPYFEITLSMLKAAGVEITPDDGVFRLEPTPELHEHHRIDVPHDTSAAVVWRALQLLDNRVDAPDFPDRFHPDDEFERFATRLESGAAEITADLADAPDLAPVLAAVGCLVSPELTVVNASHLRHKESDRIEDLAEAFGEVGFDVESRPDGFRVPAGDQTPEADGLFDPRGDHRLVMAALVLSTAAPLRIADARCVHKSYPDLWRQARRVGFGCRAGNG